MRRRDYLKATGAAGAALGMAGCMGGEDTETDPGTDDGTEAGTDADVVRIGSDIPYPPFEMMEDGEATGFDPDIGQAVFADQLDREYVFEDTAFDGIIQGLNNGNYRVIMSAMTINDDRAEQVDFSDPYFTAYQTIAVFEDSGITTKEDLRGQTVAVQKGTTGADAAGDLQTEFDGDLTIKRYDSSAASFNALLNNQAVAVINDNTVSAGYVEENDEDLRFVEGDGVASEQGSDAPPYLTLTVEEYGIAFRQDDDAFREQVNEALATIQENGTYDEIYAEYFSG